MRLWRRDIIREFLLAHASEHPPTWWQQVRAWLHHLDRIRAKVQRQQSDTRWR